MERKRGRLSWEEEENAAGFEGNGSETNLKPLVQLDVILVSLSVVVLSSSGLSPKAFCEFERTGDGVVKNAIVFARLAG